MSFATPWWCAIAPYVTSNTNSPSICLNQGKISFHDRFSLETDGATSISYD